MVADPKSFTPWFEEMEFQNPLDFPGYEEKILAAQEKTKLHEAVTIGEAKIYGESVVLGICDARFMMSSMGHIRRREDRSHPIERATEKKLPVILFYCSGGARMQEGIISLMQMEKTSARPETPLQCRFIIYSDFDRSNNRRSHCQFCHVRRYHTCRTKSTDRFCRSKSDRADDRRETAGRIPAGRISVRAWICRCDRGKKRFKKDIVSDLKTASCQRRLCEFYQKNAKINLYQE